jgi:hypothetical protein
MFVCHAQLKDGAGDEIEASDQTGHNPAQALMVAMVWGGGALGRTDDPDAYVQYTMTQSK